MADPQHKIKQLIEERATLAKQAEALIDHLTDPEKEAEFDKIHERVEGLTKQIEARQRQRDLERQLEENEPDPINDQNGDPPGDEHRATPEEETEERKQKAEQRRAAFRSYLRFGMAGLDGEQRSLMGEMRGNLLEDAPPEVRAQAVGSDTAGGFLVPDEFEAELNKAQLAFGGMFRARTRQFTTSTGRELPIPTRNDTGNMGALLNEGSAATELEVSYGQVRMNAYMYTSRLILVSRVLLIDAEIDVEAEVREVMAERLGRIFNFHLTTGDGASKPEGLVVGATLGVTAASATALDPDELYDLKHSVDPAYRVNGPEWMFNDNTLLRAKKLKDGEGRTLWQPGLAVREPNTIDGDTYVINQDMASVAADAKIIAYGDMRNYRIRRVRGTEVLRLSERYAENLQVGFLAFQRLDGRLINAGVAPVKFLQMASS